MEQFGASLSDDTCFTVRFICWKMFDGQDLNFTTTATTEMSWSVCNELGSVASQQMLKQVLRVKHQNVDDLNNRNTHFFFSHQRNFHRHRNIPRLTACP